MTFTELKYIVAVAREKYSDRPADASFISWLPDLKYIYQKAARKVRCESV
jgi:hypothetical protein